MPELETILRHPDAETLDNMASDIYEAAPYVRVDTEVGWRELEEDECDDARRLASAALTWSGSAVMRLDS